MAKLLRGMIVGASTLPGKELAEELSSAQPAWDLHLTDTDQSDGRIAAAGDEAVLIQPLHPGSFADMDVVFFASDARTTRAHWNEAKNAGAEVVDLTGALEKERGTLVFSPWVERAGAKTGKRGDGEAENVKVAVIVPAHPAAVMIGVVAARLHAAFEKVYLAATVMEPASQQGSAGVEEMHQQTVSLLGFHALPQDVYDAQVAFNLRVSVCASARANMSEIAGTIRRHLMTIAGAEIASSTALQLVQAPVFHGYTMSIFAELPEEADIAAVRKALEGGVVEVTESVDDSPNNQNASEQSVIRTLVTEDEAHADGRRAY